ncbi:MAG: hypothetical protein ACPGPS_09500 [Rubripirellula sp.]
MSRFLGRTTPVLAGRYEIFTPYHNAKPENEEQQPDKFHHIWTNGGSLHENTEFV